MRGLLLLINKKGSHQYLAAYSNKGISALI